MTNKNNSVLYTGATSDLYSRTYEHKQGTIPGFSSRYHTNKLVYYECYRECEQAFERELQIKSWSRQKKINLIESMNPLWLDLASEIHNDGIDRYPDNDKETSRESPW